MVSSDSKDSYKLGLGGCGERGNGAAKEWGMDEKEKRKLRKAIIAAGELESRLADLGLYLAGSPAEIRDALEKMLK